MQEEEALNLSERLFSKVRKVQETSTISNSAGALGEHEGEQVLIEGVSGESDLLLEGRTRFQAPDIDGCVLITAGQVNSGDLVPVRITEAHVYDLVGEVIDGEDGSAP